MAAVHCARVRAACLHVRVCGPCSADALPAASCRAHSTRACPGERCAHAWLTSAAIASLNPFYAQGLNPMLVELIKMHHTPAHDVPILRMWAQCLAAAGYRQAPCCCSA